MIVAVGDAQPRSHGWHQYDLKVSHATDDDADTLLAEQGWRRTEDWRDRTATVTSTKKG